MIVLPSLRALDQAQGTRIWLAAEPADLRSGFDRLAERVRTAIGEDPLRGHLFVFRSRRGDRLKILVWDRDGFVLWYQRLERGVFKMTRAGSGARSVELRASELGMVLDGVDVSRLKRVARYQHDPCGFRMSRFLSCGWCGNRHLAANGVTGEPRLGCGAQALAPAMSNASDEGQRCSSGAAVRLASLRLKRVVSPCC